MRTSRKPARQLRRILVSGAARRALHETNDYLQRIESLTSHSLCSGIGPCTKVHGLLRTGTNYLSALVSRNFPTIVYAATEAGWKHGPIEWNDHTRFVVTLKNPYSWIVSFRNWEIMHERLARQVSIEQFLEAPVSHQKFANAWGAKNPIDAWNKAMNSWMSFRGRANVRIARYEDLISDLDGEMTKLETLYRRRCSQRFINIADRADDWQTKNPRGKLEPGYYVRDNFMAEFSEQALRMIHGSIDREIAEICGYAIV